MSAAAGSRFAWRRSALGVDLGAALNLVGALLKYLALSALLGIGVALLYGESVLPFVVAGAGAAGGGWLLQRLTTGKERVGVREGFFVVAFTWILGAAFFATPYLVAGEPQLGRVVDAYFEAMSGMTTTGASVLTNVEELPRSVLMWRQFSQWIGGMGIIVLALAVLPRLRVGGRQLFESELPGPEVEQLTASIRTVAQRLWVLYVALTAVLVLVLACIGWSGADPLMSFYDAVAYAFTTMPTGGFGTKARSVEEFAAPTQWVLALFMTVAGMNFALIYALVRRAANPFRDEEFRLYLVIMLLASAALVGKLVEQGLYEGEAAVRHSVFQAVSMMTTTGYASVDFNEWPVFAGMILVGLMIVGGSAGSTAGAIKVVRVLVTARILRRELDQTVHREVVVPIRLNGSTIDERTVRGIGVFVTLYLVTFLLGTLALVVSETFQGVGELTWAEAVSATATTLGNVGPGLGQLGPMASFAGLADTSIVILVVLMWMGRLELLPVIILFTREYWRR
ncbi:MAG TPA: TrkH family potassium uptake protein [Gaiellaceae bacterium]|nr:TrkH family potassium uptake protein [Gaiellaceae bacterium]